MDLTHIKAEVRKQLLTSRTLASQRVWKIPTRLGKKVLGAVFIFIPKENPGYLWGGAERLQSIILRICLAEAGDKNFGPSVGNLARPGLSIV